MLRFKQILWFALTALAIAFALKFALTANGDGNRGGKTAANEIHEAATGNNPFGRYSKMAAFALQQPDARLLMPVKGVKVRQIADTWGAARSGGRSHGGQDIFAKKGTPVFSATEGYVLHVGEGGLGGKKVFVLGKGGRRYYYAHLDDFAADLRAGDWVTTDSLLGYVGTTGNAKNTPPHLHFGVYGNGGAINPLPLLNDRV